MAEGKKGDDMRAAGYDGVSVRFILSLINTGPEIEPESFALCPFLLAHPEKDRWTPVRLSRLFFDRLVCKKEIVLPGNAGHFPIEQPGLRQLEDSAVNFLKSAAGQDE